MKIRCPRCGHWCAVPGGDTRREFELIPPTPPQPVIMQSVTYQIDSIESIRKAIALGILPAFVVVCILVVKEIISSVGGLTLFASACCISLIVFGGSIKRRIDNDKTDELQDEPEDVKTESVKTESVKTESVSFMDTTKTSMRLRFYETPIRPSGEPVPLERVVDMCLCVLRGIPFSERALQKARATISGPDFRLVQDQFLAFSPPWAYQSGRRVIPADHGRAMMSRLVTEWQSHSPITA